MNLVEAAYKLAYQFAYRSWYNTATGEFVKVNAFGSHAKDAAENPEKYGLSPDFFGDLDPKDVKDRDPRVLGPMCGAGWIRIAGEDRNNPQVHIIFEGADLDQLKKLARRFFSDMGGELRNVTLKLRSGDGHAGKEYPLRGVDEVKAALVGKEALPTSYDIDANDSRI